MFINGVNDTSNKLFGDANNTCDKFIQLFLVIGDVVDTGNIFITGLIDTGDKLVMVVNDTGANIFPPSC